MIRRLLARLFTGSDPDALRYARFAALMAAVLILASALLVLDITTSEPDRVQVTSTTVLVTPATASAPVPAVIKEER